jgi:hypothetical protein
MRAAGYTESWCKQGETEQIARAAVAEISVRRSTSVDMPAAAFWSVASWERCFPSWA